MSGFTPGPWRAVIHGNETYPYPLSVITADGASWVARDGTVSTIANVHLIKAAPDMYEALDNLENDDGAIPAGAWEVVQDALAKARGES